MALYLARIPAGLAIVIPMVAVAFAIICTACVFSAPTRFDFQGTTVPLGLSLHRYESWAADHPNLIICDFPYNGPCPGNEAEPTAPLSRALAERQARQNYATYAVTYNSPPNGLMIRAGLWVELEVVVAFIFGLGFASLIGQRMVPILLMIIYEVIFPPSLLPVVTIPHLINLQRSLVIELAVAHFEPGGARLQLWDCERTRWAWRLVTIARRVDDRGGICHRGLAGRLDASRRMADGNSGTREESLAPLP